MMPWGHKTVCEEVHFIFLSYDGNLFDKQHSLFSCVFNGTQGINSKQILGTWYTTLGQVVHLPWNTRGKDKAQKNNNNKKM